MGRQDVRSLPMRLERAALLGLKGLHQGLRGGAPRRTVFIAGLQRSGTNMLMEVLERDLDTTVIHERDPRAFDNYQMRPPEVIAGLQRGARGSLFVIKALCELQRLNELMQRFAPAQTVWLLRAYDDVVNSMLRSFPRQAGQIHRLARNPAWDGWRGEGMSEQTLALIRAHDRPDLDDASAAALIWYLRNVLFFEQGLDRDGRVCLVAYERLVEHPAREFARVFDFLGLDYRPWHGRWVVPSSVRRGAAPAIDPGVRAVCDGLTARFQALLGTD